MSLIRIHFDGDITTNHQVSLRTLAKSLTHLQNSFDRAFLEIHYGKLWKYAKMKNEFYEESYFLVQAPKEGGYILDFLRENPMTKAILDRVAQALDNAVKESREQGLSQIEKISASHEIKIAQVKGNVLIPKKIDDIIKNPDKLVTKKYADRAITREIDQILSLIRDELNGDSSLELELSGTKSYKFDFNRTKAKQFHSTITKKQLGDPILYTAIISSLDRYNRKGKIEILETKKISNLFFYNEIFFEQAMPYFSKKESMKFIGSPLIEYGAFDPYAGDIYFIGVTK